MAIPLLEQVLPRRPVQPRRRAPARDGALDRSATTRRRSRCSSARAAISPSSPDVRTYLALHYARGPQWQQAVPLLEQIVAESPERLPAVEGLARVRERQGRVEDAVALRQKVYALREPTPAELDALGEMEMSVGHTAPAIAAFERARGANPSAFRHDFELGLLYLEARRFTDARDALDRVPTSHPERAMLLFKRAQVSVLLNEPDRAARIDRARQQADAVTRPLIARERLFK